MVHSPRQMHTTLYPGNRKLGIDVFGFRQYIDVAALHTKEHKHFSAKELTEMSNKTTQQD
jgi:hypothetical protein